MVVLFGSCAMFQAEKAGIVGTWTNSLGTVWVIKADGTFDVTLPKSKEPDVIGKYTISGDSITVQETKTKGPKSKQCKGPATYKFKRSGDSLSFTKVSDTCKLREKNIMAGWTRRR
jgi:hypothetical protein